MEDQWRQEFSGDARKQMVSKLYHELLRISGENDKQKAWDSAAKFELRLWSDTTDRTTYMTKMDSKIVSVRRKALSRPTAAGMPHQPTAPSTAMQEQQVTLEMPTSNAAVTGSVKVNSITPWSSSEELSLLRAVRRARTSGADWFKQWQSIALAVVSETGNTNIDAKQCSIRWYTMVKNFLTSERVRAAAEDKERFALLRAEFGAYVKWFPHADAHQTCGKVHRGGGHDVDAAVHAENLQGQRRSAKRKTKSKRQRQPVQSFEGDEVDEVARDDVDSGEEASARGRPHFCGDWIAWFRWVIYLLESTNTAGKPNWTEMALSVDMDVHEVKQMYWRAVRIYARYLEVRQSKIDASEFWFMDPGQYKVDDSSASELTQLAETFKRLADVAYKKQDEADRPKDKKKKKKKKKSGLTRKKKKLSAIASLERTWRAQNAVLRASLYHPSSWEEIAQAVYVETNGGSKLTPLACERILEEVTSMPLRQTEAEVNDVDCFLYWDPLYERQRLTYQWLKAKNKEIAVKRPRKRQKPQPTRAEQDDAIASAAESNGGGEDEDLSYEPGLERELEDRDEQPVHMDIDYSTNAQTGGSEVVEDSGVVGDSEVIGDSKGNTECGEELQSAPCSASLPPRAPASQSSPPTVTRIDSSFENAHGSDRASSALLREQTRRTSNKQPTSMFVDSSMIDEGIHQLSIEDVGDSQEQTTALSSTLESPHEQTTSLGRLRQDNRCANQAPRELRAQVLSTDDIIVASGEGQQAQATASRQGQENSNHVTALRENYVELGAFEENSRETLTMIDGVSLELEELTAVCKEQFARQTRYNKNQRTVAASRRRDFEKLRRRQSAAAKKLSEHRNQASTRHDSTLSRLRSISKDIGAVRRKTAHKLLLLDARTTKSEAAIEVNRSGLQEIQGRVDVLERTSNSDLFDRVRELERDKERAQRERDEHARALKEAQQQIGKLHKQVETIEDTVEAVQKLSVSPELLQQVHEQAHTYQLIIQQHELFRAQHSISAEQVTDALM